MDKVSRMKSDLLNRKHELYKILNGENAPMWWNCLKEDKDIYIEIRKGNVIDAYYLGGRMAEIKLDRDNQIVVTAHPKYLGFLEEDGQYYRKGITDIYISSGLGTNKYQLRFNNKPSFNLYRLKAQS